MPGVPEPFTPRLEILPPPQRALWDELGGLPASFTLYGDTAVALDLGHRASVDFDFFARVPIDGDALLRELPLLRHATVTDMAVNTLGCTVDGGGPVRLSFFGVPRLPRLRLECLSPEHGVRVGDLLELAGMKVSVVQRRAEAKDYLDIDAILTDGRVSLPWALAAGVGLYGDRFNPQVTLKALCFFEEGDLETVPQAVRWRPRCGKWIWRRCRWFCDQAAPYAAAAGPG